MHHIRLSILFLLILNSVGVVAQSLAPQHEAYIDSVMNATFKQDEPGAVALVAKNGVAVYRKAFGLASAALAAPNKPEYAFAIGSMTKQFTAVAMLKLAQAGKLALGDDVRKYVPDYNTHGRTITIEHLLTHTSGIPSYTEMKGFEKLYNTDLPKKEMLEFFMKDSLLFEPGTDWSYSNSGYFLAGYIIEKVTGSTLRDYFMKHLFFPAGMVGAEIGAHGRAIKGFVTGHEKVGGDEYAPARPFSWSWSFGAGDIVCSVDDLLQWDKALYGEKVVKQEWLKKAWRSFTLTSGEKTNYGYGWSVSNYQGNDLVAHGGAINGYLSNAIRIPAQQLYVVVLTNNGAKGPNEASMSIAMRLAGTPVTKRVAQKADPTTLREYTGVYEVKRIGGRVASNYDKEKTYRFLTASNDTLFSQRSGQEKSPLQFVDKDLFMFKDGAVMVRFNRDAKGAIVSATIFSEPMSIGPDQIEPKTSMPLPKERVPITLPELILNRYAGTYDFGNGFQITVTVKDGRIYEQATGQMRLEIFPESETRCFLKIVDATLEFLVDANGKTTGLILHQMGKHEAKKIE